MSEPDEALLWAREQSALPAVQTVTAYAYRAGAAASEARIKALEERIAELEKRLKRSEITEHTPTSTPGPWLLNRDDQ